MAVFFQILGVIFLVLIVILFLLFMLAKNHLKDYGRSLTSAKLPDRIHLKEYFDPEWTEYDEFEDIFELLFQYGFVQGRSYTVKEMPDLRLATFFHEKNRACCVVHDDDYKGIWADFIICYEDGEELTFSNDPHGKYLGFRPDITRLYYPNTSFKSLFRKFRKGSKIKPMISISNINFKKIYEESYKKDREWINKRPGITADEKLHVSHNIEDYDFIEDYDEEYDIDNETDDLYDECMDEFIQKTPMSVAKWENYQEQGDFVVVSDVFEPEEFVECMLDYVDFSDEQENRIMKIAKNASSSAEIFKKFNLSLSPEKRAKKIEKHNKPVEFEIYWFPME